MVQALAFIDTYASLCLSSLCCYWQREGLATLRSLLKQRPDLVDVTVDLMAAHGDALLAAAASLGAT